VKKLSQEYPHHIGKEAINNENNIPLYMLLCAYPQNSSITDENGLVTF